jgi:hypothetical protein
MTTAEAPPDRLADYTSSAVDPVAAAAAAVAVAGGGWGWEARHWD